MDYTTYTPTDMQERAAMLHAVNRVQQTLAMHLHIAGTGALQWFDVLNGTIGHEIVMQFQPDTRTTDVLNGSMAANVFSQVFLGLPDNKKGNDHEEN